jgi:hypothetical protein
MQKMGPELIIGKDYYGFTYDKLYIMGMTGSVRKPLQELTPFQTNMQLLSSPIIKISSIKELSLFHLRPPANVKIEEVENNGIFIYSRGLGYNTQREIIDDFIENSEITRNSPSKDLEAHINPLIAPELGVYAKATELAARFRDIEIEQIWAAGFYNLFLRKDCGYSPEESVQMALSEYGLPEELRKIFN